MKSIVTKPTEVNIKYLDAFVGGRVYPEDIEIDGETFDEWDDLFEKYPTLKGETCDGAQLFVRINVDTGHVDNWPANIKGYFEILKVVDEGIYILRDNELNELGKYEGYVPKCLEIERKGYGDYWEFRIDDNGLIPNWRFEQKDINELLGIKDNI